jgi:hypothetical protein
MDYYSVEKESAVRVVVLTILGDIGCDFSSDVATLLDDVIALTRNEDSHKVIAQTLTTLLKLAKCINSKLSTVPCSIKNYGKEFFILC